MTVNPECRNVYCMVNDKKNEKENNMNDLNCKVCETEVTNCSEDATAVTCSSCVNDSISNMNNVEVS